MTKPPMQSSLLARRVPRAGVVLGRAYIIHARNGGVGVAVADESGLGYRLHREKLGRRFLFTEIDWDDHELHGTAIPLRLLPELPPVDDDELLTWLADRESEYCDEIADAYNEVLADFKGRFK